MWSIMKDALYLYAVWSGGGLVDKETALRLEL